MMKNIEIENEIAETYLSTFWMYKSKWKASLDLSIFINFQFLIWREWLVGIFKFTFFFWERFFRLSEYSEFCPSNDQNSLNWNISAKTEHTQFRSFNRLLSRGRECSMMKKLFTKFIDTFIFFCKKCEITNKPSVEANNKLFCTFTLVQLYFISHMESHKYLRSRKLSHFVCCMSLALTKQFLTPKH